MLKGLFQSPIKLTIILCSLVLLSFSPAIYDLILFWWNSEEYNYGLLVPFIAGYIFYQKRHTLFEGIKHGSTLGLLLLLISMLIYIAALFADIESIKRYTLVISLGAVFLSIGGLPLFKRVSFILLLLAFSLPLPYLLGSILTTKMQLLSSDIGVWFIRIMGLPVFQDGNVINMSGFQMLVAEACSGLRYLYPLMAIALIISYFYRASLPIKALIFLFAIPITIGMNSLRIAVTGLLIKNYGKGAAEGFLHDFEGWIVFVVAFALLLGCIYVLSLIQNKVTSRSIPFSERIQFDWPDISPNISYTLHTYIFGSFVFICISATVVATSFAFKTTEALLPSRQKLATFPFYLNDREIYPDILSKSIKDVLKADDYFLADYKKKDEQDINLYIVYYENQKDGSALHSPKACLPGGGWKIHESSSVELEKFGYHGFANRVVIEQDSQKLLVYYWIHQNGKNFANEFKARFSLLKQSISTGRTDGALIRVITPISSSEESFIGSSSNNQLQAEPKRKNGDAVKHAEESIDEFIRAMIPVLPSYLPK